MQRPTSVTVFGILNIVFGALGLCAMSCSVLVLVGAMPNIPNAPNPLLDAMQDNPGYALYLKISTVVGMLGTLVVLASGIGLLRLQPWGRLLAIGYSLFVLVTGPIGLIVNWFVVWGPMMQRLDELPPDQRPGVVGGLVGGLAGGVLGIIYYVVLLYFMLRPNVKAAFQGQAADERFA